MKRLLISFLPAMVVVLFACNDKGTADNSTSDKHKEMMEANRQVFKAIETGDSATLHKYISDDAMDHGTGDNGADLKGAQIVSMLTDVHNSIDNLKFEVMQEAANDEYVFCMTRMTGTVKKPVWGMPVGMKCDSKSVDLVRIKDMKMAEHWAFMDPAEMMKMMPAGGAMPATSADGKMHSDTMKK